LNAPHLVIADETRAPSVTAEYMLYQALLGSWHVGESDPDFAERVQAYALKAARESKAETSWLNPNTAYEEGLRKFIARILDPTLSGEFLDAIGGLARRLALLGALNSLSQVTLKATLPGVPDFYQGTELWDFSMVDPDNRRPVDFGARAAALHKVESPDWRHLAKDWTTGHIKLAWTRHLLKLRNELSTVFTTGGYEPLDVSGRHRDHIIAFARRRGAEAAIVVVGRVFAPFTDGGRTWLQPDTFDAAVHVNGYTIEHVSSAPELQVSSLFTHLPATVLKARVKNTTRRIQRRIQVPAETLG
jgi:(1->4)-alpha-D-glucan 1-alpha-D-glucosylmutase